MPKELRAEVHDIVQEAVIKIIPKEKKLKKAKWLSEEALQIAEKRSKRQRRKGKIYPSECRVPNNSKDKKAFLSNQYKEIEEKNRMGKTRDLFKKTRDTKGTFHVKMDTIKDRNDVDLTEAKDTKWQEYKELYKTDLHDPDNHDGVIMHLEPDILE